MVKSNSTKITYFRRKFVEIVSNSSKFNGIYSESDQL